jgi:hypothetical protein
MSRSKRHPARQSKQLLTVQTNVITSATPFDLNGNTYQLGWRGTSFRTNYSGQSNTPGAVPSGWFGGSAVGIGR